MLSWKTKLKLKSYKLRITNISIYFSDVEGNDFYYNLFQV